MRLEALFLLVSESSSRYAHRTRVLALLAVLIAESAQDLPNKSRLNWASST